MLTFLALLCVLWIAYWSFALWRDKEDPSPVYISRHECADCSKESVDTHTHVKRDSGSLGSGNTAKSDSMSNSSSNVSSHSNSGSSSRLGKSSGSSQSYGAGASSNSNLSQVSAASSGPISGSNSSGSSNSSASSNSSSTLGSSTTAHTTAKNGSSTGGSKSGVVPLFSAPATEADDLKEIKGVGKVMEQTLNDLGITTFKQLAEFQDAEVQMVTDALSESNAGFGDRITRDEWVSQAKVLAARKH